MADPTQAPAQQLSAQPGWSELSRATDDLHAAELLLGDPLAPARTAAPHLKDFWRGVYAAGLAAQVGDAGAPAGSSAWLSSEQLAQHLGALAGDELPQAQLKAQARAARELLRTLEPLIGAGPLRTRKRRIGWTTLGLLILFTPLLAYVALNTEVPGEGPWRASYFSDRKLESTPISLRELAVDHDWGKDAPLEEIPPDKFSVRWDSCLRIDADQAEPVIFQLNANDGVRMYVDGELVIDGWERDSGTSRRGMGSAELELPAGVHHLRVEYYESLGGASIKFAASFDGSVPAPLPDDRLLYPGDSFDEDDPCAAVQ